MSASKPVLVLSFVSMVAAGVLCSSTCRAEDETPSIVNYGFRGFFTGAELGLAIGFLATGPTYQSHEWRDLVLGAGIGALSGLALGISLGVVDASSDPPARGGYVLRDLGYGTTLGAVAGAAVGALFLVDSGRPKDVLVGAAVGGLIGAGAGVVFGVIEGSHAPGRPREQKPVDHARVRPTLVLVSGSRIPLPGVAGSF